VQNFLQKHASVVTGSLKGFDRLVFRGTLRRLAYVDGLMSYLGALGILLKDFGALVLKWTEQVKAAAIEAVERAGRPVIYMPSGKTSKEETARQIAERDNIREGLVCMLTAVESCQTFELRRNRERKRLELCSRERKCLHLYRYEMHPSLGLMHVRIQTWLPFSVQVYLNGREWLGRQLDQAGIEYRRADNCFLWLADVQRAQELMDSQLRTSWPQRLDELVARANPGIQKVLTDLPLPYYWSVHQSEWATDVMFRRPEDLSRLYPLLVHHGIKTFGSTDVMRFLGRSGPCERGKVPASFKGECVSSFKERPEGVRLKHSLNGNSLKIYDKERSLLRAETTINNTRQFKVFRTAEGDDHGQPRWLPLRKGVADLHRLAQVADACNQRYLTALASVSTDTPLGDLACDLCRPTTWQGRRVRALNPFAPPDANLLRAISRAEFCLRGLENKDLRTILFPPSQPGSPLRKRHAAATTRLIRLLRGHGLLTKIPKSRRYRLSSKARDVISAILAAHDASAEKLSQKAA
jgi:hypothetical protein